MKDLDPQQNASSAGGERRHGDTTYPESWATVAHALKVSAREPHEHSTISAGRFRHTGGSRIGCAPPEFRTTEFWAFKD